GVGERGLEPARVAPLDRDIAERNRRLNAVGALYKVHMSAAQSRRRRECGLRHVSLRPATERFVDGGADRGRIDVADDDEEGVVGTIVLAMERIELRLVDRGQRGFRFAGPRVRMLAEEGLAEL